MSFENLGVVGFDSSQQISDLKVPLVENVKEDASIVQTKLGVKLAFIFLLLGNLKRTSMEFKTELMEERLKFEILLARKKILESGIRVSEEVNEKHREEIRDFQEKTRSAENELFANLRLLKKPSRFEKVRVAARECFFSVVDLLSSFPLIGGIVEKYSSDVKSEEVSVFIKLFRVCKNSIWLFLVLPFTILKLCGLLFSKW